MNKRQKKKQEKKRQEIILKDRARIDESFSSYKNQVIEVGDTVEVVGRRYGGYKIGTLALVVVPPPRQAKDFMDYDFCVSDEMNPNDLWAMIHHREDLELIKKGAIK